MLPAVSLLRRAPAACVLTGASPAAEAASTSPSATSSTSSTRSVASLRAWL